MDYLVSLLLSVPISHWSWQVLYLISSNCIKLMNVRFCWLVNTGVSMCNSPLEDITYEFVLASPAVPNISYLSYLDGLWDRKWPHSCHFVGSCFQNLSNYLLFSFSFPPPPSISLESKWGNHTVQLLFFFFFLNFFFFY